MAHTYELKNAKILYGASEETHCFEGTLYVDGKKVGLCTNAGHGGPNEYGFPYEIVKQHEEHLSDWARERFAAWCAEHGYDAPKNDTSDSQYIEALDSLVNELLEMGEVAKTAKRERNKYAKKHSLPVDQVCVWGARNEVIAFHESLTEQVKEKYPDFEPVSLEAVVTV